MYYFLRFLIKPFFYAYYRKVSVKGIENIPPEGPVLYVGNHPNSFLDGIVLALVQKRKLHFLTRSDVFKNKIFATFIRSIGLIPIYRSKDKGSKVKKNQDVFRDIFKIFDKGGAVLIFAEGASRLDRDVQELKKGAARLALSYNAVSDKKSKVTILPCGINYFSYDQYRSPIAVEFESELDIAEIEKIYLYNEANALLLFNKHLKSALITTVYIAKSDIELSRLNYMLNAIGDLNIKGFPKAKALNEFIVNDDYFEPFKELDWQKDNVLNINWSVNSTSKNFGLLNFLLLFPRLILSVLLFPFYLLFQLLFYKAIFINRFIPLPKKFDASLIFAITFLLWLFLNLLSLCLLLIYENIYFLLIVAVLPAWYYFPILWKSIVRSFRINKT